jgi:hypothetical protein
MRNFIGTRRILPAVLAVGVLLVVALVAVPLLAIHRSHASAHLVSSSPSPTTSPAPVPSGAVTLAQGARLADGIEIGYPHTILGAISAASDYLDAVASTLDPDYAASVMRVAGDPANGALPVNLAASTVTLRADLQLPTGGPLDAPIAFQTIAEMYQLRDTTANDVLVLLLLTAPSSTYTAGWPRRPASSRFGCTGPPETGSSRPSAAGRTTRAWTPRPTPRPQPVKAGLP